MDGSDAFIFDVVKFDHSVIYRLNCLISITVTEVTMRFHAVLNGRRLEWILDVRCNYRSVNIWELVMLLLF